MTHSLEIRPLSGAMGAEVLGVDLSQGISDEMFAAIHAAFLEYQVLVFPKQRLAPEDLTELGRRHGELLSHPYLRALDGFPHVHEVRKEPESASNFGSLWHSDGSFQERPVLALLLYARAIPQRGGDTLFINQYKAYEALSDGMKRMLGGLKAVHAMMERYLSIVGAMPNRSETEVVRQSTVHPVVRTHPETGRKSLYLGGDEFMKRFEDMTEAESRPLLDFLHRHAERPEFQFRLRWKTDDLCLWDNRCTMHYALNDYPGETRLMQRVMVLEPSRPT